MSQMSSTSEPARCTCQGIYHRHIWPKGMQHPDMLPHSCQHRPTVRNLLKRMVAARHTRRSIAAELRQSIASKLHRRPLSTTSCTSSLDGIRQFESAHLSRGLGALPAFTRASKAYPGILVSSVMEPLVFCTVQPGPARSVTSGRLDDWALQSVFVPKMANRATQAALIAMAQLGGGQCARLQAFL